MAQRVASAFNLLFCENGDWVPLPAWSKFLISLGSSVLNAHLPRRRIFVTVSVPTASFAAAFIALGRILSQPISEPANTAVDAHFEKLGTLPCGTPLAYFDGKALYHGPLIKICRVGDGEFVRMAIGQAVCMIPKHRCLLVEAQLDADCLGLNGLKLTRTGRLRNPKPFISHFFSLVEHYRVLCTTAKSVVIIGEVNRLRAELQSLFAVETRNGLAEGSLQDLLRIAKFSSGGVGCRGDVYARTKVKSRPGSAEHADSLMVLDGSSSLLRWAHVYSSSDTIAILSRTEAEYDAAVDAANARYLNRLDECTLPGLPSPPAGIHVMVHSEATL